MKRVLFVVALFALLAGCASTPKLDATEQARLTDVRIDPAIAVPEKMYYLGPGSGVGMMFGAIGGLVTALANMSPGDQLNKFALDNDIHIDQIVKEEAAKAFQSKLKLTDAPGASTATLKISINMYGFSIPNGFSGDLVPIVDVKVQLVEADGRVVWSANESTHPLGNPVDGSTPDDFRKNPKLIEEAWRAAAKAIMTDIASHM